MEFKTAEERILWELDQAENKVEELKVKNSDLSEQLSIVSEEYNTLTAILKKYLKKYLKKDSSYFSMYVSTFVYSSASQEERETQKRELDLLSKYATDELKKETTDDISTEVK